MNRLHGIIFAFEQRTELRELTERRTGPPCPSAAVTGRWTLPFPIC